jgi:DNA polymerase elongation subunit (family B)
MSREQSGRATTYVVFDIEAVATKVCRERHEHPADAGMPPPMCFRAISLAYMKIVLPAEQDAAAVLSGPVLLGDMETTPYPADADLDVIAMKAEQDIVDRMTQGVRSSWPVLVTWNGRGFDLPLLAAAALDHGLSVPWLWSNQVTDRYRGSMHIDLQEIWSMRGAARSCRMAAAAERIGFPGKMGTTGADVEALWRSGAVGREQVRKYNACDTAQETAILLRSLLVQGLMDPNRYLELAQMLLEQIERNEWLADLRGHIDTARFLSGAAIVRA